MKRNLFIILLALATLAYLATDIYLPSLPHIALYFNTTADSAQLTLSLYMLTLCVSPLIFGPLSDGFGRKPILYIGFAISLVGTLICVFAPTIEVLIIGRLIQGLGMGAMISIPRAIFPDLFQGKELITFSSYFMMAVPIVLSTAPVLGGYIQSFVGWQGNFVFLFFYTAALAFCTWRYLPETNQFIDPRQVQFKVLLSNFVALFKNTKFIGFVLCSTLAFAGISAYMTTGPFLLQEKAGLSASVFGWVAGLLGLIISVVAWVNTRLVHEMTSIQMVTLGAGLMFVGGAIGLIFTFTGAVTTTSIVVPTAIYITGMAFTFSNSFAGAFTAIPTNLSGAAGALMAFLQIFAGSVASAIIAFTASETAISMSLAFLLTGTLSLTSIILLLAPKRHPAT